MKIFEKTDLGRPLSIIDKKSVLKPILRNEMTDFYAPSRRDDIFITADFNRRVSNLRFAQRPVGTAYL
jgi:hypothetical protein